MIALSRVNCTFLVLIPLTITCNRPEIECNRRRGVFAFSSCIARSCVNGLHYIITHRGAYTNCCIKNDTNVFLDSTVAKQDKAQIRYPPK